MKPSTSRVPSGWVSALRWESGKAAGPWITWPWIEKREPWHGHSKRVLSFTQLMDQPRWLQLTAKKSVWLPALTAYPE